MTRRPGGPFFGDIFCLANIFSAIFFSGFKRCARSAGPTSFWPMASPQTLPKPSPDFPKSSPHPPQILPKPVPNLLENLPKNLSKKLLNRWKIEGPKKYGTFVNLSWNMFPNLPNPPNPPNPHGVKPSKNLRKIVLKRRWFLVFFFSPFFIDFSRILRGLKASKSKDFGATLEIAHFCENLRKT